MNKFFSLLSVIMFSSLFLSGCGQMIDRMNNVGNPPPLEEVYNPQTKPEYKPLTWPLPEQREKPKQYAGSLWQTGSRHFFRDQRASREGDIIKVLINIRERAQLNSQSRQERDTTDSIRAPKLFGLESAIYGLIPGPQQPTNLIDIGGETETQSRGIVLRQEQIQTEVAALVTQVLPNGNLVIEGNQEILLNDEIRKVGIAGVIRPQDIKADNTIEHSQVAQARITYGGRGEISEIHRPRWGQQAIDIISPF